MNRRLLSGLLICWLSAACFSIRPVEPPNNGLSEWISPSDYEILLQNFRTAISQRNPQNYLRCFAPEVFRFDPAAQVLDNGEAIWRNWSLQDEQTYLDNLFRRLSTQSGNSLLLEERDLRDVTPDSLRYVGLYTLRVNHTDTTLTTLFRGQLELTIRRNSFNEWEIRRWTDTELYADSSWSRLKLRFVQ
ncbi:MAG: hypothetical protein NW241_11900 [Bacteroidia bacterium]|nr:hypothetical protein [Bacteroidia bacterium]